MASCKVPLTGLFAQGVKVTQYLVTSVARNRKVDLHLRTFNLEIPNSLKCQDFLTNSTVPNSTVPNSTPMAFVWTNDVDLRPFPGSTGLGANGVEFTLFSRRRVSPRLAFSGTSSPNPSRRDGPTCLIQRHSALELVQLSFWNCLQF